MPPLPRPTAAALLRALKRLGFVEERQRGSHLVLRHHDDPSRFAVVAVHSQGTIPPGTLKSILASTRLSSEDLVREL